MKREAPLLQLRLLGNPTILCAGQPITGFLTRKVEALFYYLAVSGNCHERFKLATLLWPDFAEQRALKNLRDALSNLRQLVGSHLIITCHTAAFDRSQPYWLDTEALEELAVHLRHPGENRQALAAVVDLYQGDFLDGFHAPDVYEFQEWALFKCEQLRDLTIQALEALTSYYLQNGNLRDGLDATNRLLMLEPWHEASHRNRMYFLALNGQRPLALLQYERCREILIKEFDIEPMAETQQLYESIRDGRCLAESNQTITTVASLQPQAPFPLTNLPRVLTPLVGRDREIADLRQKICDPAYPLVTLVGAGGIGKTRLALAAATQVAGDFTDGVWYVPLAETAASCTQADHIVATAIARSLAIPLFNDQMLPAQLITALRHKEVLLVLDNCEHIAGATEFLLSLLLSAPYLKLLVTSRYRLNLHAEIVFEVQGLSTPPSLSQLAGSEVAAFIEQYSSLQLFQERARRQKACFRLDKTNLSAVIQICRLVEGSPLAIELAATLIEQYNPQEILLALQSNYHVLNASLTDLPPRHRSMVAVFDDSWKLLTDDEARTLAQCAIFRGGMTPEAAIAVTGANPLHFTTLLQKSLLRQADSQRYTMPELLRQFAAEKLTTMESLQPQMQLRHYVYYMNFLTRRLTAVTVSHNLTVQEEMRIECGNVIAAWQIACERNDIQLLRTSTRPLAYYLQHCGLTAQTDTVLAHKRQLPD